MSMYFYENKGNKIGPVTIDQMKLSSLHENTLVWKEGLSGWVAAKELPELNDLLIKEPPPLPHEQKRKESQEFYNGMKYSISKSLLSRQLWFWYLIVTSTLAVILAVGDIIGDGNDKLDILFPVYKTNWEREHPFLAILKSTFFLFIYSGIVTIAIGLVKGIFTPNLAKKATVKKENVSSQSQQGPSIWEPIIIILLFLIIVAIIVYVN